MKRVLILGAIFLASTLQAQATDLVAFRNYVSVHSNPDASEQQKLEDYRTAVRNALDAFEPKYVINPKLGRAWVEVTKKNNHDTYHGVNLAGQWLVPGLSYDLAGGAIVLNGVVVATVTEKTGWFGLKYTEIAPVTPLKLSIEKRAVDDGFYITETDFEVISI